jgi:glycosyltransferase involved in cell wall biosynthesis
MIITISEFNYQILIEKLRIEPEKIKIIPCGVDTTQFQRRIRPNNATPIVLSIGGLVEKKGHEILLRACAYLKKKGLQFQCRIIGAGPLLKALLSLRKPLNIEDCVHLCGPVHHSELRNYLEAADIFVLACLKAKNGNMDGIPVALMEAMAMELPVVTTNLSGIPELVEAGLSGFLVEPGDPKVLAERMEQLFRDRRLREQMGQRGREKILQDYDQAKNLPLVADTLFREIERV